MKRDSDEEKEESWKRKEETLTTPKRNKYSLEMIEDSLKRVLEEKLMYLEL